MIIDCVSDLHGHYPELEGGDLLIVAGDLMRHSCVDFCHTFVNWIKNQKYKKKIVIAGNHDTILEHNKYIFTRLEPEIYVGASVGYCTYLCDSGTEFEGLKIWGSPWTKAFDGMNPDCKAFTRDTEKELAAKWALIPEDTDILITHSPPMGVHDLTLDRVNAGSLSLLMRARQLRHLKLFVWGHIHECGGDVMTPSTLEKYEKLDGRPATCQSMPYLVNASHVNERYQPVNKPVRVVL